MIRMGFSDKWVEWILLCITTVNYRVAVNGEYSDPIKPGRGLRQGDPLSPYLFILCAEVLSKLIRRAESQNLISGCRICRQAPAVTHLFFADDSFLFFGASSREASEVIRILTEYEVASGQAVNLQKSGIFFSSNVNMELKEEIKEMLRVQTPLDTGRYLGLPSLIGRSKRRIFAFLVDRLRKKFGSWGFRFLSQAGKEVLLKSVAQALPTFCMSTFLIPLSTCDELKKLMNSFWWGMKPNGKRGIHWFDWAKLCNSKDLGGMSFKNLHVFNLALLGKQGWKLINTPNILVSRMFKAKYFPREDLLLSKLGNNPSMVWRGIWSGLSILKQGMRWRVGNGESIKVWDDPWVPNLDDFHVNSFVLPGLSDLRVADLMDESGRGWDMNKLHGYFSDSEVSAICDIILPITPKEDVRMWHWSQNGFYNVRSGYLTGMNMANNEVGYGGWKKLWNLEIPPKLKMFIWRVCSNCLPTRTRLVQRRVPVSLECPICVEDDESDRHLFTVCSFAGDLWRVAGLRVPHIGSLSFSQWLLQELETAPSERLVRICCGLKAIWEHRNRVLWREEWWPTDISWHTILDDTRDWKAFSSMCKRTGPPVATSAFSAPIGADSVIATPSTWSPPPAGSIKCNTDGASFAEIRSCGLGAVVRDETSHFLFGSSCLIKAVKEPKIIEALAVRTSLSWLASQHFINVVFESDAKLVVDAVNSDKQDNSEFGLIVQDCRDIINSHSGFNLCFIHRSANKAAHVMARRAYSNANDSLFSVLPIWLADVIREDASPTI